MKRLFMVALALCLTASASYAYDAYYGWEDEDCMIVLGQYGEGIPPIIASKVSAPDPVYSGIHSLRLEDNSPTGTPQAYIAWITGLTDGDSVYAEFCRYDDTPGASPSCRIWGHWNDDPFDINGYNGSAGGNVDYGPGTGWDVASHSWTVSGGHTGLVIECRTYSNPGDVVWIDDLFIQAPASAAVRVPGTDVPVLPDLSITDIVVTCEGGSFYVEPAVTFAAYCGRTEFTTDLSLYFDGELVESIDGLFDQFEIFFWDCPFVGYWPDNCHGSCPDIYGFFRWYEGFCTPNYHYLPRCACAWAIWPYTWGPFVYAGQQEVTVRIDSWGVLQEFDEGNNVMTVPIGPTAVKPTRWGTIKSTFR